MIPLEITIYCDKSNSKNVIRKIGFKDEPWMDKMRTGTSIDFIEKRYMVELQSKLNIAKKALELILSYEQDADMRREMARQALKEMERHESND